MNLLTFAEEFLDYCQYQRNLSEKTLKAYRIDLQQFTQFMLQTDGNMNKSNLSQYLTALHKRYKPKSAKRKIASTKVFFSWLEYEDKITENPFAKIKSSFREPFLLPKTISLANINKILSSAYKNLAESQTEYQYLCCLRDTAILELLFATGARVSEICTLKMQDVDLDNSYVKFYGKGAKERLIQIGNEAVLTILQKYAASFHTQISEAGYFFINRLHHPISDQSVRFMINKYTKIAGIQEHLTPHMFRHSFATLLLEEDVDIRYIQQLLGHSSITTTQIYTHISSNKQKDILTTKHPRNKLTL